LDFADLSDTNLPKCLLCQRQFKSIEVLQKHSRQSELHQTNLKDESKVNAAKEAISNIPSSSTAAGAASQYRDRALERRSALNQPDHPPPPSKRHKGKLPVNSVKAVRSAPEKEIEETNIGSKLLAGMGWRSGSGLGSSAAGRAAPVQAKAFASGAGIGASQGGYICIVVIALVKDS
jgi:RNA-binding protein 5/10